MTWITALLKMKWIVKALKWGKKVVGSATTSWGLTIALAVLAILYVILSLGREHMRLKAEVKEFKDAYEHQATRADSLARTVQNLMKQEGYDKKTTTTTTPDGAISTEVIEGWKRLDLEHRARLWVRKSEIKPVLPPPIVSPKERIIYMDREGKEFVSPAWYAGVAYSIHESAGPVVGYRIGRVWGKTGVLVDFNEVKNVRPMVEIGVSLGRGSR